jgi:hypothetical protein
MVRLSIQCALALLCFTKFASAWQQDNVNTRSWSGVIINSGCTVDEAFAESDKCFEKRGAGTRLSLYDDTIRQIYELDAQDQAARYFGDSVTVEGTLQGDTIHSAEIKKLTSIGLEVGQKAPAFSARDQFGREQNLETLQGHKGTVLLFFRSADW